MIIYGVVAEESIGKLFMGGIFPGLLLAFLFMLYAAIRCWRNPSLGPPLRGIPWRERFASLFRGGVWAVLLLAGMVLGSMYFGICTPTEAAALGAGGAIITALLYRKLNWENLKHALLRTTRVTCMIIWIYFAASIFTTVMAKMGISAGLQEWVVGLKVSKWVILALIQLSLFFLGMILDPAGIVLLTVPIFLPIIRSLGFDPLWFGIIFTVNMEMAYITPPFGFNLYVMKGIVPPEFGVSIGDIWRGCAPFVALQALGLALVIIFPEIALFLPSTMK